MQTYISILRGINVSGQKKIIMSDLKDLYEGLGFSAVQTYIQSGNVIFNSDSNPDKIIGLISQKIKEVYDFDVPIIIRTHNELTESIKHDLFLNKRKEDQSKLHITFLEASPNPEIALSFDREKFLPDEFIFHGKDIYLYTPNGYGRTKLNNNFFESKLKMTATTRNLKTVRKLIELSLP
ncbi:MAG: DUF1697 domain-containing protein [Cyclobacteriaceae bacterium]|nr:DUF1697 domain-containing protein [Cyclobacteriaceae bacterium]